MKAISNVVSELIITSVIVSILLSAGFFFYSYLYTQSYEMQTVSMVQELAMNTDVGILYYNGTSLVFQITTSYGDGVLYGFGILYAENGRVMYSGAEKWYYMSSNTTATINATVLAGWTPITSYWNGTPYRVSVYPFYVEGRTNTMMVSLDKFIQSNITLPLYYVKRDVPVVIRVDNINPYLGQAYLVVFHQIGYKYYGVLYIPLSGTVS